jgi:RNase P/RNase MRP subunit POP5
MTGLTLNRCMCARQRKLCGVVIECRRLPRYHRMTSLTIMREVAGHMVRICRSLKVR